MVIENILDKILEDQQLHLDVDCFVMVFKRKKRFS